jgi:hypothetical protein
MTKVVKEVVAKVVKCEGGGSRHRDDKLVHVHPDLCAAVIDARLVQWEALCVPPHRQEDSRFKPLRCVRMAEDHRAGGRDKAFGCYLATRHEQATGLNFHVTCEQHCRVFCCQRALHIAAVLRWSWGWDTNRVVLDLAMV